MVPLLKNCLLLRRQLGKKHKEFLGGGAGRTFCSHGIMHLTKICSNPCGVPLFLDERAKRAYILLWWGMCGVCVAIMNHFCYNSQLGGEGAITGRHCVASLGCFSEAIE